MPGRVGIWENCNDKRFKKYVGVLCPDMLPDMLSESNQISLEIRVTYGIFCRLVMKAWFKLVDVLCVSR